MAIWLRYFAFGACQKFSFGGLQIFVTILVRLAFLWTIEVAKWTFFCRKGCIRTRVSHCVGCGRGVYVASLYQRICTESLGP